MNWKLERQKTIKVLNFLCPDRVCAEHNNWHKLEADVTSPDSDSATVPLAANNTALATGTGTQPAEGCQLLMTSLWTRATMRRLCADPTAAATTEGGCMVNAQTMIFYVIVGRSIIGSGDKGDLKYSCAELMSM